MSLSRFKPGLRTVKSAIAIGICVLLSFLFKNRELIFFGGVACVICMQQTHKDTIRMGLYRIAGTCLGGALGYATIQLAHLVPNFSGGFEAIFIPLAALIAIYLCNLTKAWDSISISCIVLLNVTAHFDSVTVSGDAEWYVFFRVVFTIIGVIVALLVNVTIFPYKATQPAQQEAVRSDDN